MYAAVNLTIKVTTLEYNIKMAKRGLVRNDNNPI